MRSIMEVVSTHKMTNNPANVMKIYCEHPADFPEVPGGQQRVATLVSEFFSDENLMRRLILYRDEINKSKRRGQVPYHTFYKNCLPEDRLYNMFNQPGEAFIDIWLERVTEEEAAAKERKRQAEQAREAKRIT